MLIQIQEKANMEYSFFIFNRIYVGIQSNNYLAKTIPILIDLVLLFLFFHYEITSSLFGK